MPYSDLIRRFPIHHLTRDQRPEIFEPFATLKHPPHHLYIQGAEESLSILKLLNHRGLGVVGTRYPQPRSTQLVHRWIEDLAGESLVILSGFARGIDAAAHRAALKARLPTIAVIATGHDILYPREHSRLREEILEGGGLMISEHPPGTQPFPSFFTDRNRLIAALSKAVWIVEASHKSGAMSTAHEARQLGRDLLVTPCFPGDPAFAGNQQLLDHHGHKYPPAAAFWDSASLGHAWNEYSSRGKTRGHSTRKKQLEFAELTRRLAPGATDEQILAERVNRLTHAQGSVPVHELLDFAISCQWSPQRFFIGLERALHQGLLVDENGLLLKKLQ